MTWFSPRSGMASTGVSRVAYTPQTARAAAAASTRTRLRIDASMIRAIISTLPSRRHQQPAPRQGVGVGSAVPNVGAHPFGTAEPTPDAALGGEGFPRLELPHLLQRVVGLLLRRLVAALAAGEHR